MKRVRKNNLTTYYNDNSNILLELFYNEGKIDQLRFHFDDEDPSIKNKTLSLSPTIFKGGFNFSFDKVIDLGDGRIKTESYDSDEELWMYNIVERTPEYRITRLFYKDDTLISEKKVFYNKKGIPYRIKNYESSNEEPYRNTDYRIPIFPGFEDSKNIDEEKRDELNDLINSYLWSDFVEPYEEEIDLPF